GGLERGERVALHREVLARHTHDHRERASRLALAVRAVAGPLPERIGVDAVGHTAAKASAGDGSGGSRHEGNPYTSATASRRPEISAEKLALTLLMFMIW